MLSILPFRVLYAFSDLIYYLVYYIIGYRKKVVLGNLRLAFPQKSDEEITAISKKFFRHFVDVFGVEMVKSFTMSKAAMAKRYQFKNIEVVYQLENQHKSAILLGSHYANWEWIFNLNLLVKYNGYAIYKKIKNPYFDHKIRQTRGKFNTTLVSTKEIFSLIEKNSEEQILSLYGFLGDQSPKLNKIQHRSPFLGVMAPAYIGVEVLSKKHQLPILFFSTKKVKRGHYEATFKLLTDTPNTIENYKLTDLYLSELEKQIEEAPEFYLWTHKRFKHVEVKGEGENVKGLKG